LWSEREARRLTAVEAAHLDHGLRGDESARRRRGSDLPLGHCMRGSELTEPTHEEIAELVQIVLYIGYSDPEDNWLCESCYEQYIKPVEA